MSDQNHGSFPPPPAGDQPEPTQAVDARQIQAAAAQQARQGDMPEPTQMVDSRQVQAAASQQAPQQPGYGQPQAPQYGTPAAPAQQEWNQQAYAAPTQYGAAPVATTRKPSPILWAIIGLLGLGTLLALIGAFGPWAHAEMKHPMIGHLEVAVNGLGQTSGTEGNDSSTDTKDGWFTLVAGILLLAPLAMVFLRKVPRIAGIVAIVLGLVIVGISIYDIVDINDKLSDFDEKIKTSGGSGSAGTGWGLWLTLVSGLMALAGGALAAIRGNKA